jgi:DNA-binding XRE family transcriptional regulator
MARPSKMGAGPYPRRGGRVRDKSVLTLSVFRATRGHSQEAFAQEAKLNRAYMGGIERGQRNVGVVNLCDWFSQKSFS